MPLNTRLLLLLLLLRWGPVEKLGLDESFVDLTSQVEQRMAADGAAAAALEQPWHGQVVSPSMQLTAHSRHRPMDLRAVGGEQQQQADTQQQQQQQAGDTQQQQQQAGDTQQQQPAAYTQQQQQQQLRPPWAAECEMRLRLGALIAAEMRRAVQQETGYR
jgi:hypothetical protein